LKGRKSIPFWVLWIESRDSWMIGKCFTTWATAAALLLLLCFWDRVSLTFLRLAWNLEFPCFYLQSSWDHRPMTQHLFIICVLMLCLCNTIYHIDYRFTTVWLLYFHQRSVDYFCGSISWLPILSYWSVFFTLMPICLSLCCNIMHSANISRNWSLLWIPYFWLLPIKCIIQQNLHCVLPSNSRLSYEIISYCNFFKNLWLAYCVIVSSTVCYIIINIGYSLSLYGH
jgi:hypothetical protein